MALKSYKVFGKKKKKSRTRDLITGGVTAIVGVGLLSTTANAVAKI